MNWVAFLSNEELADLLEEVWAELAKRAHARSHNETETTWATG